MKIDKNDIDHARKNLPKGTRLITCFRGRSASGMCRWYDVYAVGADGKLDRWTGTASAFVGRYDNRREAIRINGAGFSGAQEIAQAFAYGLHGDIEAFEYQEI